LVDGLQETRHLVETFDLACLATEFLGPLVGCGASFYIKEVLGLAIRAFNFTPIFHKFK
jgi:hypothetical protein